jgi:hypothetical protein
LTVSRVRVLAGWACFPDRRHLTPWPRPGSTCSARSAVAQARIRLTADATEVLGEFTPRIEGSTIYLDLAAAVSAVLPTGQTCVWDCQITQAGKVSTLAGGTIDVTPEVIR